MKNKNKKGKILLEGVIYEYTNKINGKVYIGQTTDEGRRIINHRNSKHKDHFHNAIRKYGWNSFEYKVLFKVYCFNEQDLINTLNIKEAIAIKYFKSTDRFIGYNMTFGGSNATPTEETKRKISESNKGKIVSEETRRKISEAKKGKKFKKPKKNVLRGDKHWNFGKHHSPETRRKISEAHKGKPGTPMSEENKKKLSKMRTGKKNPMYGVHKVMSEETRRKISEARKGKNAGEKHPFFGKKLGPLSEKVKRILSEKNTKFPVIQLSLEKEFIKEWPNSKKAGEALNINSCNIRSVCSGESITAGGYRWLYKPDYDSGKYTFKNTDPYNARSIVQLDLECNFINKFKTISEASRSTNTNRTSINATLAHKRNTAGGFIWLYKEEYDELVSNNKLKETLLSPKHPIVQTDRDGNFIKEWNSMEEAAENLNVSAAIIRLSILNNKGVRKLNWNKFFKKEYYYGTIIT